MEAARRRRGRARRGVCALPSSVGRRGACALTTVGQIKRQIIPMVHLMKLQNLCGPEQDELIDGRRDTELRAGVLTQCHPRAKISDAARRREWRGRGSIS